MNQRTSVLAFMVSFGGVAACGGDVGEGAKGDGVSEDTGFTSPVCAGAGWTAPDATVAAGFAGSELVFLRADGSTRVVHRFEVPADIAEPVRTYLKVDGDGITAHLSFNELIPVGTFGTQRDAAVRVDRTGAVLWSFPGAAAQASAHGVAGTIEGRPAVATANGEVTELAFGGDGAPYFVAPPDAAGWVLTQWRTAAGEERVGLVNVDGRIQELPGIEGASDLRVASHADKILALRSSPTWELTLADGSGSRSVPLDPGTAEGYPAITIGATFSMVVGRQSTAFLVDMDAGTARAIELPHSEDVWATNVLSSGDWFLGKRFASMDLTAPMWLVEGSTGSIRPIPLEELLPLRRLEGDYCDHLSLLPDGTVGMGLRDDAEAAFYVGSPDGAGWERIGGSFRDVTGLSAQRIGGTWIVTGNSGKSSYCPAFEPFTGTSPESTVGDAVQVIGRGTTLAFETDSIWEIGRTEVDPTGACVFRARDEAGAGAAVFDLASDGTSTTVPPLSSFTWL